MRPRRIIGLVLSQLWMTEGGSFCLSAWNHAAMTASVELAAGKARSAALFKKPSQQLEEAINHGRYAAITARGFVEMQGRLPAVIDDDAVGANP